MHILSPETENCPSWISGRERMTVENISWPISTKKCCRPRWGLNPRPPGLQSDGAANWATEASLHQLTWVFIMCIYWENDEWRSWSDCIKCADFLTYKPDSFINTVKPTLTEDSKTAALTFTILWVNSADDKLLTFFLFVPENRIRHFMQGDNLHEMSNPVSWKKNKKKYFKMLLKILLSVKC